MFRNCYACRMRRIARLLPLAVLSWMTGRYLTRHYFRAIRRLGAWWAGLAPRRIPVGDHSVAYLEGGHGETVLLLHGFGVDSDAWLRMAHYLTPCFHVIAPDLPGWGASTRRPGGDYGAESQATRVHAFMQALGIRHYHVLGNSMGGYIGAVLAARFPGDVRTLALLSSHGVHQPHPSPLARAVLSGHNPMIVRSEQDLDHLLDLVFTRRPYMPRSLKRRIVQQAQKHSAENEAIFWQINPGDRPLLPLLPAIQAPCLILWGREDRIIDVSSAGVFRQCLVNAPRVEAEILADTGHAPMIEQPKACARIYRDFLRHNGQPGAARQEV